MNKRLFFFLPALLFLGSFILFPFIQLIYLSFFSADMGITGEFVGLQNYLSLLTDPVFIRCALNSLAATLVTPFIILLSLCSALLLRENLSTNKLFRALYFLPVIAPLVITGIVWKWSLNEETGFINYGISLIGLPKIQWLSSYPENFAGVLLVTLWRGFGYYMMTFLAGIMLIPKELEEAAILDGANTYQRVVNIIIPQLKQSILFVFVVSAGSAIKLFTELYILIPGAPMKHKTLVSFMFKEAFERFDFGIGSAAGVLLFLLTIVLTLINIKMLNKQWD